MSPAVQSARHRLRWLIAGDFRRPLAAGWEADVADELVERLTMLESRRAAPAMTKDPLLDRLRATPGYAAAEAAGRACSARFDAGRADTAAR